MRNFQETFETRKQSDTSAFSICMNGPSTQKKTETKFYLSHFQFSNVSTDTTVILKEKMLNEKST